MIGTMVNKLAARCCRSLLWIPDVAQEKSNFFKLLLLNLDALGLLECRKLVRLSRCCTSTWGLLYLLCLWMS